MKPNRKYENFTQLEILVDIEKWMVFVLSFNQMNNDGNYYGHITEAAFTFFST